jgi:dipeptidyl aminopeptidase/acylaminoacyl peptidase
MGIVLVVAAGCTQRSGPTAEPGPAPVDASALELGEPEVLDGVAVARLSPDGSRLLRLDRGLCVTDLDGDDDTCVAEVNPDTRTAQWSPDGTKVVFTDDFFRLFDEPDVWVLDVASGEVDNLTDDGIDDFDFGDAAAPGSRFDVLPSWSPDGGEIWFARADGPREGIELMSIDADGGEATRLRAIDCGLIGITALAFTADRAAWTCGSGDNEVRAGGRTDDEETVVVPVSGDGQDYAALTFSPDGSRLLVDSIGQYGSAQPRGGLAVVVPADGSADPRPVADGDVAFPTWAPGGEAIAFIDLPGTLKVVSAAGESSRTLLDEPPMSATTWQSLDWVDGYLMLRVDGETRRYPLAD